MVEQAGPAMHTDLFEFDNSYAEKLSGFYVDWKAAKVPEPELICFNKELAEQLGLELSKTDEKHLAQIFAGNEVPAGAHTLAQVYAGHQFGGFSPQLGDGRALLIGETLGKDGIRRDIQLKGSGPTPFSRNGDGKAAIGPVLREYLMAEAMHALGIPTTRALAAVTTGEEVFREAPLPGAILTRVASSHVRVGTFQFFASRGDMGKVQQLADYVIWRHYPDLGESDTKYVDLLKTVGNKQANLIAQWMTNGFIHGVMNTDNMTLSGETIDYGPCAFMDHYAPNTVFSSIDEYGRYAYNNQPVLAQWNLARFAECLLPLLNEDQDKALEEAKAIIEGFTETYDAHWTSLMRRKLGLMNEEPEDLALARTFLETMQGQQVDFTLAFRHLGSTIRGEENQLRNLYQATTLLDPWLKHWQDRIGRDIKQSPEKRAETMDKVNPLYIPRNHRVEEVLKAAQEGDMQPFNAFYQILQSPFDYVEGQEAYTLPAPDGQKPHITFCGT